MADVGPIDILQETNKELAFPIIRDMDTFMYERQSAGSMEVGSYAHRPIFHHPNDIPSNEEAALSPTMKRLTARATRTTWRAIRFPRSCAWSP